jgi:hypothetical protein
MKLNPQFTLSTPSTPDAHAPVESFDNLDDDDITHLSSWWRRANESC